MTYYTAANLRQRAGSITASAARSELSHMAKSAANAYDVFLSHSVRDAVLVLGLKKELEAEQLTVYVDWLEDPTLDRAQVTPQTAQELRNRMRSCRALVYATSRNAAASRWMPWELGYFDGHHAWSRVAICPIQEGIGNYPGEEYLGVYRHVERLNYQGRPRPFVVKTTGTEAQLMQSFVSGDDRFLRVTRGR